MTFLKSTISYIYNSVKSYFIKEEEIEEVPKVDPNFENLPKSVNDFDKYIQYLKEELQDMPIKINILIEQKNENEIYKSLVQAKTNELFICILQSIKLRSEEQNLENLTNNAINECNKHIELLKEEFLKELRNTLLSVEHGNVESVEHNIQMEAFLNCSDRLSKIKLLLEEQKDQNQNIESSLNQSAVNGIDNNIQENAEDQKNKFIDEFEKRIETLNDDANKKFKEAIIHKKKGDVTKTKECLKSKAFMEKSVENYSKKIKMLELDIQKKEKSSKLKTSGDQSIDYCFELYQSCYEITNAILDFKMSPDFDDQIDEEYENLDVSQVESSPDENDEEKLDSLMAGFT